MKAYYIRVSTIEQNTERQDYNVPEGYKVFKDKCSGSIPFKERTAGSVLFKHIEKGEVSEIKVHSIDRLGRDTLDIMNTIQFSTSKGVNVVSHKEGLQTLIDGRENPTAKLMIGILATLSEFEKNRIRERQLEGIARAKDRNVYVNNGGNKKEESTEDFLNKPKVKLVIKHLKQGESVRRSAKLSGCSVSLVQKVKKLIDIDSKKSSAQSSKEEKLLSYIESNRERELLEYLTERLRTGVINEDLENEIVDAVKKAKAQYNEILHNKESVGKKNMLGANEFVDALPKYIRLFVKNEGVGINNYIKHFKIIDKEFSNLKEW